jgi:hypothetical protein
MQLPQLRQVLFLDEQLGGQLINLGSLSKTSVLELGILIDQLGVGRYQLLLGCHQLCGMGFEVEISEGEFIELFFGLG